MAWWYVAVLVISIIAAYAVSPKAPEVTPPSLDEGNIPTVEQGGSINVVFGTHIVREANIVWYGDLDYVEIRSKGGK